MATIIRVGMAREAAKNGTSKPKALTFDSLKTNLSSMFGLIFAGGLITWIMITDGVRDTSFALSMNLMPIYLEDIGRMTTTQIGWMNSLFGLCVMLTTIPGGWLSDKTSERVVISIGMALIGSALLFFISVPSGTTWLYFASWALAGSGVGLMSPAYQSLISKAVPQELRGTAFGLFSTSLGIISLPAPLIGGQIWANFGPGIPFMITGIVALLSIIPVLLKFRVPKNQDEQAA
jgi:MFS family permease